MRIVTLEEHFILPECVKLIDPGLIAARGWPTPGGPAAARYPAEALAQLGAERVSDMDASGISLQILSTAGPGAELLEPAQGLDFARRVNDELAAAIEAYPGRFAGFTHMPMSAPEAAAAELERTVTQFGFKGAMINGVSDGLFLDDPRFGPILAKTEALDVPIYIHPSLPPPAVRAAYYDGLPHGTGHVLATSGWGWHSEVAIHLLRMVLAGTLDRHPKLKLIIGHMGEGLPAMMQRCDSTLGGMTKSYLSRTVSQTILDQVWITTSGFFALAPFVAALMTFGAERILFSVDYPFSTNKAGVEFLRGLPVSAPDRAKIAHGNADRLLGLTP